MTGSAITGVGLATPSKTLTSAALEKTLGLAEGWIETRTGIERRRIASETESSCTLGTAAARAALADAGIGPADVDYVIAATVTPDFRLPATASLLQTALECNAAAAFDLNAGCSGFLCGLAQADALVRAGSARNVLVVGVELLSRITDFTDPKTGIIFGDGAGAAVIGRSESAALGPFALRSDGSKPDLLMASRDGGKVVMAGREVYRRAVHEMTESIRDVTRAAGIGLDEVDLVVPHQANGRILEAIADRLGTPRDKLFSNIARYGNTSAASIPMALAEAQEQGALRDGDLVVLAAFGAGFVWGAGIVRWGAHRGTAPATAEVVARA
ncbi:MAG TPA: beta-ketoacyl-ACP synthase III [Actinomycetota bacterium]|nr:beta-ketoacyl-ACP synthase III [Actinomycetota bacterium]